MNLSILVTLIIIFVTLLVNADKKGKKQKKPVGSAPNPPVRQGQNKPRRPSVSQSKMQDFKTNSPKNEGYFTYETLETDNLSPLTDTPVSQEFSVEDNQQIIENEKQKNVKLSFDEEEIKKGIIYSIILERVDY